MYSITLQKTRKKFKKTQKEVADILGISYQAYAHYEKGRREPTPEQLIILSNFYGITIDELLGQNFTSEEKALGVGRHATYLSEDEWEWLELRSLIIEAQGEQYLKTLQTMLSAIPKKH